MKEASEDKKEGGFKLDFDSIEEKIQNRKPPEKKVEFRCVFCKKIEYREITESNQIYGPGGYVNVSFLVCEDCGLVYAPEKFIKTLEE